jgi:hypothetical protein
MVCKERNTSTTNHSKRGYRRETASAGCVGGFSPAIPVNPEVQPEVRAAQHEQFLAYPVQTVKTHKLVSDIATRESTEFIVRLT